MLAYAKMVFLEMKGRLRFSAGLLFGIALPLCLLAAMPSIHKMIVSESQSGGFSIAVVDLENSLYTQIFTGRVLTAPSIQNIVTIVEIDFNTALTQLKNKQVSAIIVIPEHFTRSMESGVPEPLTIYTSDQQPFKARLLMSGLDSGAYISTAIQYALYTVYSYTARLPITADEHSSIFQNEMFRLISWALERDAFLERRPVSVWEGAGFSTFYSLSVLLVFTWFFGCSMISGITGQHSRALRRRIYIRMRQPLAVQTLAWAGIMFLYVMCLLALPLRSLQISLKELAGFAFSAMLIALSMATLIAGLAALFRSALPAVMCSAVINIFFALASGCLIPIYFLPSYIPDIRVYTPHHWWRQLILALISGNHEGFILCGMVILCFTSAIFLLLIIGERRRYI